MKRKHIRGGVLGIRGYTIVEVMIFLAVSGGLLVAATSIIGGKQERVRFTQSIDRFSQNVQDVLNDVSTGYYPTQGNFSCTNPGAGGVVVFDNNVANSQGTNKDCVFLGKIIQLGTAPDKTAYNVFTMAGIRTATDLSNSGARLLAAGGNPGLQESMNIPVDVEIVDIVSKTNPTRNFDGVAIVSEFSQVSGASRTLSGNASRVTVYEYTGGYGAGNITQSINNFRTTEGIVVCLRQKNTSNFGALIIGASGQLSVDKVVDRRLPEC